MSIAIIVGQKKLLSLAMPIFLRAVVTALSVFTIVSTSAPTESTAPVFQTDCNGQYTYNEVAGYGLVPSDFRDKFGDTAGGWGSSVAIDKKSWKKKGGSYTGTLYGLPDRGWNTQGTTSTIPRVHKFQITFNPQPWSHCCQPILTKS